MSEAIVVALPLVVIFGIMLLLLWAVDRGDDE